MLNVFKFVFLSISVVRVETIRSRLLIACLNPPYVIAKTSANFKYLKVKK